MTHENDKAARLRAKLRHHINGSDIDTEQKRRLSESVASIQKTLLHMKKARAAIKRTVCNNLMINEAYLSLTQLANKKDKMRLSLASEARKSIEDASKSIDDVIDELEDATAFILFIASNQEKDGISLIPIIRQIFNEQIDE